MRVLEYFLGGALSLIFVYLLVQNARGTDTVVSSLSSGTSKIFSTLQGR